MASGVALVSFLTQIIASKLGVEDSEINIKKPFFSIGISSLISEEILAALGESYQDLSSTLLFEYSSVERLSAFLATKQPLVGSAVAGFLLLDVTEDKDVDSVDVGSSIEIANVAETNDAIATIDSDDESADQVIASSDNIAIIGISGKFPKASSPEELWQNLLRKTDCVSEIPEKRWDAESLYKHFEKNGLAISGKWGGFIEDIEFFDPLFFQIPHREAELIDPQQKLFLQCGWELMEDAGYANNEFRKTDNIGVYVGVTWNEFSLLARDETLREADYKGAGSLYWSIPNRLSYFLNLTGPSVALDTACSSSLVAIHDACQAIKNGDCEMAIAGGINLNLHPAKYQFLSQNHFLSSDGRCKSFGEGGDGYVPSEGVVAVLLKPLDKAIADGDQVYGVIKGTATNHGGKVTGYTVPNPMAHSEVISKAIERAGLRADQISYVECHGTGTDLGDPIEITGLSSVFDEASEKRNYCAIGSLKSNIGHLEAAAGIAGLIKILLAMRARQLPASLHSENENRKLKLSKSAFRLVKDSEPWGVDGEPLRAGVSSFGAGGSNAHMIVESFVRNTKVSVKVDVVPQIFVLSAESEPQLRQYAERFTAFLQQASPDADSYNYLRNVCYSLLIGRTHFNCRLAIIANGLQDVVHGLCSFLDQESDSVAKSTFSSFFVGHLNPSSRGKLSTRGKSWSDIVTLWPKAWVVGKTEASVLVSRFEENVTGIRLSLPKYPFLKERSWLHDKYPLVPIMENLAKVENLHPLVDCNTSSIYSQSFSKDFDIAQFVLKDHLVNEVHVIPGVCHLEMARVCAEHTLLDKVVEVKDVWFSNVISVKDKRKVEILLQVDGEDLTYRIWDPENDAAFSRGKISWPKTQDKELPSVAYLALADIRATMQHEWFIPDVYQKFIATGVIQKKSFQVLQRMQFNGEQALSKLSLPDNLVDEFLNFGFHPALMDGIVQTAMMHVQYLANHNIKILPFHISSVKLLRPMESEVFVYSQVLDIEQKRFDLTLCNESGEVLVVVSNFILREMKAETAREEQVRKPLALLDNENIEQNGYSIYYTPEWKNVGEIPPVPQTSKPDLRSILVINPELNNVEDFALQYPRAIFLTHAESLTSDDKHYFLDQANFDHIQSLVQELGEKNLLPEVIVYCGNPQSTDAEVDQKVMCGETLFLLAKALITKIQKTSFVVFCSETDQGAQPFLRAATGFFKTLVIEKPSFSGRVVTLENKTFSAMEMLGCALREVDSYPVASDVRYEHKQRQERHFVRLLEGQGLSANPVKIRHDGVYLITGGMGGIGLIFARYLLQKFNATVYLSGRSPLNKQKQVELQTLAAQTKGAVNYVMCDVNSAEDVATVIARILENSEVLHGILHSAGTIDDGFILRKEPASFRKVVAPKIYGSLNLDHATRDLELDFLCFFSSVTAILGNLGQCDYGYANAFEDNFSAYRNALVKAGTRVGKTLSINWPYWQNGGMQLSEKEEAILTKTFGFVPLQDESGISALVAGLASTYNQIAALDGDHEVIQRNLGTELLSGAPVERSTEVEKINDDGALLTINAISYLKNLFSTELKIPQERIDTKSSFDKYGFDSIVMIDLINLMGKKFKNLPKTLFFEYQTIEQLASYFVQNHADHFGDSDIATATAKSDEFVASANRAESEGKSSVRLLNDNRFASMKSTQFKDSSYVEHIPLRRQNHEDAIAIVGLAGRYPEAENVAVLWDNLLQGRDSVREVPESLWDWNEFYRPGKAQPGKSYSKWGGFLDNVDQFDALYFNISPKEAETMDPQERLFLQTATHAIQDAGYTPSTLAGSSEENGDHSVGVFVGVMWGDYQLYGVQSSDPEQWTTPRSFYWAIANRLSYFYNFSGPSMAVDTACSSSLTALHLACESLRRGEINAAVAGGVNLTLHPNKYNLLAEMQFLSSDGRCRSFGEGGDGYVPGDGVGAVVLKRLADAEAAGDNIYAVIRGTAINHGGKTSGFTVPNPHRQAELIKDALQTAGVNPRHVSYVEAHGTGTSLGDPVELIGLKKAYAQEDQAYCAIGSIKSNIGHLESAAGIAALTKVLLQFKHQKIAPSIHSTKLNSNIDFASTPFYVQREAIEWPRPKFKAHENSDELIEIPRLSAISSFGAGGSNAHIILEEYVGTAAKITSNAPDSDQELAFVFSAHSPISLKAIASQFFSGLDNINGSLEALAFTLQSGREAMQERLVVFANNRQDLQTRLNDFIHDRRSSDVLSGSMSAVSAMNQLFGSSSDIQQLVEKWLLSRSVRSLASAWVSGLTVPWERLYSDSLPGRISLPGYPFETRRFWTPLPATGNSNALHPLIDNNASDFDRVVYAKMYRNSEPLVAGHRVFGKATLPGAAQLAMALECLLQSSSLPAVSTVIRDVRWGKPIHIENHPVVVECELVKTQGNRILFEIGMIDTSDSNKGALRVPCVQGIVYPDASTIEALTNLQNELDLAKQAAIQFGDTAIHNALNSSGFEFSAHFECFETLYLRPGKVLARLRVADLDRGFKSWLSPVTFDAVLRCALLLDANSKGGLAVDFQIPIGLEQVTLLRPLTGDFIYTVVHQTEFNSLSHDEKSYHIDVFNDDGELLLSVRGLLTKLIDHKPAVASTSVALITVSERDLEQVSTGLTNWLKQLIGDVTKLSSTEIDPEMALEKYGIDSVMVTTLNEKLEVVFGDLSKTLFFEYQNIAALTGYFCAHHFEAVRDKIPDSTPVQVTNAPHQTPALEKASSQFVNLAALRKNANQYSSTPVKAIAVIGVSGRYPQAGSVQDFWRNLLEGRDCVVEVPEDRWDVEKFYQAGTLETGKSSGKWGGFIQGHDRFDAPLFKILPDQAEKMDPQERLFLQTVWSTLEDAGYSPTSFSQNEVERKVGVFAGSMWNHYSHVGLENTANGHPEVTFGWDASIANRASYFFDFNGPSLMVDTACSSSLLAIHYACESLMKGECKYAIAGGVNLSIHAYKYATLTQMQMLSSEGRCKSFGAGGDGYVPGEGVGAVLLKPLEKAIADGDHIYGVIKGSAINHNGKTNGFTVPNPVAQEAGISLALKDAGLQASDLSYYEAHGTGTRLGDPIEFNALNQVFRAAECAAESCALGSVKSNVGHLEGAAGIVALTKVLLQLQHQQLVPSLHSDELNPNLNIQGSPFYIPQAVKFWDSAGNKLRRAAISSLGAGGANAFVVVEEFRSESSSEDTGSGDQLILLSARSLNSLRGNTEYLLKFLNTPVPVNLADVAFTLQVGRAHLEHRICFVAKDWAQMGEVLRNLQEDLTQDQLNASSSYQYMHNEKIADRSWWPTGKDALISLLDYPLQQVGDMWLTGQLDDRLCDWTTLHHENPARRISLPTYVFDEQRYWVDSAPASASRSPSIAPFLDENGSNLYWQYYRKTFMAHDPVVADHCVNGNAIVAGSVLLEMALSAALHSAGIFNSTQTESVPTITVRNLSWQHAAIVENEPVNIGVLLLPGELSLHFALLPSEIADAVRDRNLEADAVRQAMFISGDISFSEGRPLESRNLDLLLSRMQPLAKQKADIYQYYRNLGLDYGSYFQVTQVVHVGKGKALAVLNSDEQTHRNAKECLQPAIVDGALRTSLLAITSERFSGDESLRQWSQLLVPQSIETLIIHASLPARVFCLIELLDVDAEYQTFALLNITLMDENGLVCAEIKRFRAVAPGADFYSRKPALVKASTEKILSQNPFLSDGAHTGYSTSGTVARSDEELLPTLQKFLKEAFAKATGISSGEVQLSQTFDAIGVDSITIVKLNRILDTRFAKLSKTLFFECKSLADVQAYLLRKHVNEVEAIAGLNDSVVKVKPTSEIQVKSQSATEPDVTSKRSVFIQAIRQVAPSGFELPSADTKVLFMGANSAKLARALPFDTNWVEYGDTFSALSDKGFQINLLSAEALQQLLVHLAENKQLPDIICISDEQWLDYGLINDSATQIERFSEALTNVTTLVLHLIQTLTHIGLPSPVRILCCYQSFGSNRAPHWDALDGLARALQGVNDQIYLSLMRLHPSLFNDEQRLLKCLLEECSSPSEQSCMLEYDARGRRHQYVLQETSSHFVERRSLMLQNQATYLISGGAGAIGVTMARYLVELAKQQGISIQVALFGRSPISDRIQTLIHTLESPNATVVYRELDIANFSKLQDTIAKLSQKHVVRGILHCAGVSADTSLLNANYNNFAQPLAAKCSGTVNLDKATVGQELDFFVLFSSITAQIGDFGAGGYSYGNAFQDNFAFTRNLLVQKNQRQGRTLSIGWPLWDQDGIQQDNELVDEYLEQFGLSKMSPELGLEVLERAWSSTCTQVSFFYGNASTIHDQVISPLYRIESAGRQPHNESINEEQSVISAVSVEHPITRALQNYQRSTFWDAREGNRSGDIAIIGVSGCYPQAADLNEFWENLCKGRDSITEIPAQRWDYRRNFSANRDDKGKVYGKWGGFIDGVDLFDAQQFNISPREAELLDPQERLFLQASLQCMDDAGYTRESLAKVSVGVYAGVMWGQYQLFDASEEQKRYGIPGSSFASIANRVSYYFDFDGPSMALDTMCSSSLTALHTARLAILAGECDYALAGGVNLSLHEKKYQLLSQGQFLSSDGRCRTFGEGGDGYVPGEGLGVVMLKRLEQAIADGDQIYGVMKGSAVNHGGRANGFTVPNPNAQSNVIAKAIAQAGWNPETISYLEAHGTGTSLGDPIEVTGLQKAFELQTDKKQFCAIGSVKSNIGHLESAAGMAGLTKVLLQLKHKKLVPSLHSEVSNPNIDFASTAFQVVTQLSEWKRPVIAINDRLQEYPLRAGISSFGAGGANAHILIEEFIPVRQGQQRVLPTPEGKRLFLFSARNAERLSLGLHQFIEFFQSMQTEEILDSRDISYTLMVGREHASMRIAVMASDIEELKIKLVAAAGGGKYVDVYRGDIDQTSQLDNVLSTEQRRDLIDDFIARKDLAGLAGAWVSGISIPWLKISSRLFESAKPQRVSLPTTPLVSEQFWIQDAQNKKVRTSVGGLHPLLDTNESTLFQQAYSKTFSGLEFYLADHIIGIQNPKNMLPGVAYIEMARAAATQALSDRSAVVGLTDLVWLKPVSEAQLGKKVTILLGESGGSLAFEVVSSAAGEMEIHARGALLLADKVPETSHYFEVQQELDSCVLAYDYSQINHYFKAMGYHDGPAFQALQHVHYNDEKAIGILNLPSSLGVQSNEFHLHPSLMDAALRTCLFIGGAMQRSSTIVPFAVDEVRFFAPLPEQCLAQARLVSASADGSSSLRTYHVDLFDAEGNVLVEVRGFSAREISSDNEELHFFRRIWQPASLQLLAPENQSETAVMVVGSGAQTLVATKFASTKAITIEYGSEFSNIDDIQFVVARNNLVQLKRVVQQLQRTGKLPKQILLLSGFECDAKAIAEGGSSTTAVNEVISSTVIPLVTLFQALNEVPLDQKIRVLCAYATDSKGNPFQVAISAFAKSVIQINHQIEIGSIGISILIPDWGNKLVSELSNSNFYSGLEIQYRDGDRWQQNFEHLKLPPEQHLDAKGLSLQKGGTYLITGGAGQLGQIFARHLTTQYGAKVVLIGRSAENERVRTIVGGLAANTHAVEYCQCNINDPLSLQHLISDVQEKFGDISAIFHCAGVVDKRTITELDESSFCATLEPKIHGLINLYEVAKTHGIGQIICFSSVSSFLGDFGGGSYAYANRFMDDFADLQFAGVQGDNTPNILSIDWPLWLDGGMQLPENQQAFYRHTGIYPVNETQGLAAFEQALRFACPTLAMCTGRWDKIAQTLRISKPTNTSTSTRQAASTALKTAVVVSEQKPVSDAVELVLLDFVQSETAAVLKMTADKIDRSSRFESFGMDSVMLMELNKNLSKKFQDLPKTTLFEYDSITNLVKHLQDRYRDQLSDLFADSLATKMSHSDTAESHHKVISTQSASFSINADQVTQQAAIVRTSTIFQDKPSSRQYAFSGHPASSRENVEDTRVAVIGISGLFPDSDNMDEFWTNIKTAKNCLREVPTERWQVDKYYSGGSSPADGLTACSKWGGFVNRVNHFDAGFFKMSDREAAALDPQLRLMLKAAWQAVEDAAYAPDTLKNIPFGVYVGVMNSDYAWIASDIFNRTGRYPGPGSFASEIANRISFILNVTGPSLTVETACASSSTAIHLARKSILNGECDMALAGGVNLSLHPGKYLMLDQMKVLAPDGVEKTFDAAANGLVPSEGVGAVILKSYAKAVADGDNIYGVISGSAIGHSGVGPALNLPSVQAMEKTIVGAIEEAGINGEALGYIESHGTGTELGDPIELKALVNALRRFGDQQEYCAIGSKSNFGHLESASGICSLIKVLLAFKNQTIPPCGNISELTPAYDSSASPLYFPSASKEFALNAAGKRYAGINSFGLGGSNAFLVLESHQAEQTQFKADPGKQVLVFSAPTKIQLTQYLQHFVDFCVANPRQNLAAVAFSLQTGRNHYQERLALVVDSLADGLQGARRWIDGECDINHCYAANLSSGRGLCELLSGEEGNAFIATSIGAANLHKLAELWVSGGQIPWLQLYPKGWQRCSLPSYPFSEREYSLLEYYTNEMPIQSASNGRGGSVSEDDTSTKAETFPNVWFSAPEPLSEEYVDKPLAVLDVNQCLTKGQLGQLTDVDYVVAMTAVQEAQFKRFNDASCAKQVKQVALTVSGLLSEEQFLNAWLAVATKASALRSAFIKNRKGFFRVVLTPQSNALLGQCIQCVETTANLHEALEEAKTTFDLSQLIPYEVKLLYVSDDNKVDKTHIVWSFPEYVMHSNDAIEFLRKVSQTMICKSTEADVVNQDHRAVSRTLNIIDCEQAVKDYWLSHLKEHTAAKPIAPREEQVIGNYECVSTTIGAALTHKLQQLTQRESIEFDVILVAAWAVIQARFTSSSHAMFALSGKFKSFDTEDYLGGCGIYESRVPILIKTMVKMSIREWLLDIQALLNEKRKYAHIPFETIKRWLNMPQLVCCTLSVRDMSVASASEATSNDEFRVEEYTVRENYDSTVAVVAILRDEKIDLSLEYQKESLEKEQVLLMLQHLEVVFESIVANSNRNPAAISLMTKQEYRNRFWKTIEREGV